MVIYRNRKFLSSSKHKKHKEKTVKNQNRNGLRLGFPFSALLVPGLLLVVVVGATLGLLRITGGASKQDKFHIVVYRNNETHYLGVNDFIETSEKLPSPTIGPINRGFWKIQEMGGERSPNGAFVLGLDYGHVDNEFSKHGIIRDSSYEFAAMSSVEFSTKQIQEGVRNGTIRFCKKGEPGYDLINKSFDGWIKKLETPRDPVPLEIPLTPEIRLDGSTKAEKLPK